MPEPTWGAIAIYVMWGIFFLIGAVKLVGSMPATSSRKAERIEHSREYSYTPSAVRSERSGFEWLSEEVL